MKKRAGVPISWGCCCVDCPRPGDEKKKGTVDVLGILALGDMVITVARAQSTAILPLFYRSLRYYDYDGLKLFFLDNAAGLLNGERRLIQQEEEIFDLLNTSRLQPASITL